MKNKNDNLNVRYTENKGVNKKNADIKEVKSGSALKKTDINFGGWFFTSCICAYMILQLVYAVAVTVVAQKTGSSVETTSGKTAFKFLAYCVCGTAIFACALFYSLKEKTNLLSCVKVKKFSLKYALIAVVCLFGLLLGLGKANDLFIYFLNKLGYNPPQVTLPPASVGNYLLGLLCICLLPAVVEEFLFRGVILTSFDDFSTVSAVILNGVLFSLFHMSPAQTVYQFLVGATYALIARKSGSVIPTTIMHFLNNALVLTLAYFFPQVDLYSGIKGIVLMVVGLVALAISCVWLFKQKQNDLPENNKKLIIKDFYAYSGGVAVCVFMWVVTLFA